jgi:hypothetical protein
LSEARDEPYLRKAPLSEDVKDRTISDETDVPNMRMRSVMPLTDRSCPFLKTLHRIKGNGSLRAFFNTTTASNAMFGINPGDFL